MDQYPQFSDNTPDPAPANPDRYSLKWHKFLIYFSLWAGAVMNAVTAFSVVSGNRYGAETPQVYLYYNGLMVLDWMYAAVLFALALFSIYVRFQLAGFRKGAPKKLILLYVGSLALGLLYLVAVSGIVKLPLSTMLDQQTLISMTTSVFMCGANKVYYDKRSELFVY